VYVPSYGTSLQEDTMSDPDDKPEKAFDGKSAAAQLPALADGLLAMLKAKQAAKESETPRAFAIKAVQGLEDIILQLFEAGAGVKEVHAQLVKRLPDVSPVDLRYAVVLLRGRNRHQLKVSKTSTTPERKKKGLEQSASDAERIRNKEPVPNPSGENDRMAHESDEDYAMRKQLESISSSSSRKKFIGEN
jgi:hypothetical protein